MVIVLLLAFCFLLPAPSHGAISFIAGYTAATTTVSITSPNTGDIIIVAASGTSLPSLAAGYTTITSGGSAQSLPWRLGYKVANGTETDAGTWANATDLEVAVYRGQNSGTPIGTNTAPLDGASTTLTYNALSLTVTTGTSWVIAYGSSSANPINSGIPAPLVIRAQRAAAYTNTRLLSDSNGGLTAWSSHPQTISYDGWTTCVIELLAPAAAGPPANQYPRAR